MLAVVSTARPKRYDAATPTIQASAAIASVEAT